MRFEVYKPGEWHLWFAWRPVVTSERGYFWEWVWRRDITEGNVITSPMWEYAPYD
jgi:hypothetical protein